MNSNFLKFYPYIFEKHENIGQLLLEINDDVKKLNYEILQHQVVYRYNNVILGVSVLVKSLS
jgi:hypothetical protein